MQPHASHRPLCEPLENRLLCKITMNGDFVITPPGGGQGHATIHMQPAEGLTGLRSARENSNGVVTWQITSTHEWTPGDAGDRLLCKIVANGEFAITPPGGGQGHSTIHMQPAEGLTGLRTAEAKSNGLVNWEITSTHEWTPGDPGGPHQ